MPWNFPKICSVMEKWHWNRSEDVTVFTRPLHSTNPCVQVPDKPLLTLTKPCKWAFYPGSTDRESEIQSRLKWYSESGWQAVAAEIVLFSCRIRFSFYFFTWRLSPWTKSLSSPTDNGTISGHSVRSAPGALWQKPWDTGGGSNWVCDGQQLGCLLKAGTGASCDLCGPRQGASFSNAAAKCH